MTEERYKRIKDSIELQSLVKAQIGVEDELLQEEIELLKAYEKLFNNWNKLKEIAKSQSGLKKKCHNGGLWFEVDDLLNKMKELEKGSEN